MKHTAFLLAGLLVLIGALAPALSAYDPDRTALLARLLPPLGFGGSLAHPLGTDQLGRDMLARCLYGLRTSLGIALLGSLIGAAIGITVGLIAGLCRGRVDAVLMLIVDAQLALPYLLIVLIAIAVFGTSMAVLIPLVSLAGWEHMARLVRGQVLMLRELPFVEAAQAIGAPPLRIMHRHLLPQLWPAIAVQLSLGVPAVMLLESSLSFLGIGVQPPTATLGRMIGEGRGQMLGAWWIVTEPTVMMLMATLAIQIVADALRARK